VRLPRLADGEGKVSFSELEGLAISFMFPEDPNDRSNFSVKLTYQDTDDDCVVIGTTDELEDAIEQFTEKKLLRITAEVKRRARSSKKAIKSEKIKASSRASNDVSTQADGRPTQPHPQIENAVDSIVTIVSAAARSIQGQLKPSPVATVPKQSVEVAKKSEKESTEAVKKETPANRASVPLVDFTTAAVQEKAVEELSTQESTPVVEKAAPAQNAVTKEVKDSVQEAYKRIQSAAENEDSKLSAVAARKPRSQPVAANEDSKPSAIADRPFIHGRHTCDGCLHTPIIGKRYHAKNMPDYDLCEKCRWNYKGNEIEFEVVELERDRPYQMRWHRRHNRLTRGRFGRANKSVRRCGRKIQPSDEDLKNEISSSVPVGEPMSHPQVEAVDYALEEALRRSLLETLSKSAEEPEITNKELEVVEQPSSPLQSTPKATAPLEEEILEVSLKPEEVTSVDEKATAEPVEKVLSAVECEPEEKEKDVIVESHQGHVSDEISCSSSKVMVDSLKDVTGDNHVIVDGVNDLSSSKPSSEISFSTDADGNGSVAAALGETLDKVSEAIDGLVSEIERSSSSSDENSSVESELPEPISKPEMADEVEELENEGATILNSVAAPNEAGEKSDHMTDDGWQVVSDNQTANTEGDAALAFAAQMIGSALFNSDMSRSAEGEMVSTISGDVPSVSSASSVPTSVNSLASESLILASQRSRWASHLEQLHEIGFYNDDENVEVLERLTAANIGCGVFKEVTVTDLMDELYKAD